MKRLSSDVRRVDETAESGDYEKALEMLDSLLKKVPEHKVLLSRRLRYKKELETKKRILLLEKKLGV